MTTADPAADGIRSDADALAPEVFPPTLREVMLRPWWIGMLVLALVVAGVFAWLGQWQLSSAIDTDPTPAGATEATRPLADVVEPGSYLAEPLVGQRVETTGTWAENDFLVVSSRYNDGTEGYWVTGQFRVTGRDAPTALAVALGWTATREEADAVAQELSASLSTIDYDAVALTGRIISDEGPRLPPRGASITEMTTMSPAALLGRWSDSDGLDVYRPYLVADRTSLAPMPVPAALQAIDSPAPAEQSPVNWLNIFYAVEWAVFAGFAFYMWYRLARDAWEKEVEAVADARAATA
jgi:cytochrome oxidase assembly protein ShyY1